jgi:dienelactone hydrolase
MTTLTNVIGIVTVLLALQEASPLVVDARALVEELMSGRTERLLQRFDEKMTAALPDAKLRQTVASVVQQAGAFKGVASVRTEARGAATVATAICDFANARLDVVLAFDERGRIVGLNIRPTATPAAEYQPPSYAKPGSFTETEVTLDAGGWPLPGTLTMPGGAGPFPAVVLVHGSGPHDRDSSFGPNRPFRDLALGRASNGLAVLRYDKRTFVHRARAIAQPSFTVKEEAIDDALAAVALLRSRPEIRRDRVFVVGHSLGGTLLPRIGARDALLGGLIAMAGAVQSLEDAILRQSRYLAELDGTVSDAERAQLAATEALVARARSIQPGDPPLTELGNVSASYLIDLRSHNPPAEARALKLPMLILQGERDYQVTLDDLQAWKDGLAGRTDVTFKSYPTLNHLFMAGTGPGNPAEYLRASHVDAAVVEDIRAWIAAR